MVLFRSDRPNFPYIDVVADAGYTDYVKDGEIHEHAYCKPVMVPNEDALTLLADYEPGTVAYTAGFLAIWQKAADGTWVSVI